MTNLSDITAPEIAVTVTFLEMRKPPPKYPAAPANRSIALLRVRRMPVHYYRYLMHRVGQKWHWVNILRMPEHDLRAYLDAAGRDIRVLYVDGAPAGFFDLMPESDAVDLAYFGLMEDAIGQGLGRWFLGAAVQAAWALEPKRVVVQTCTLDHPAALPLYQKIGFQPVAQAGSIVRPMSESDRAAALLGSDAETSVSASGLASA